MTMLVHLLAPLGSTLTVPLGTACSIVWLQPRPLPQLALRPLASTRLLETPDVYGAGTNASFALVPFKSTDAWKHGDAWQRTAVALVIYSVGLFALHLSDLVRARKSRRAATEVQCAAIVLQASARRSSAGRAYEQARNAAVKMQKLMRRHLDRVRQRQHVDDELRELESRLQDAEDRIRVLTTDRDLWRERATLLNGAGPVRSRLFVPSLPRPTETWQNQHAPSLLFL